MRRGNENVIGNFKKPSRKLKKNDSVCKKLSQTLKDDELRQMSTTSFGFVNRRTRNMARRYNSYYGISRDQLPKVSLSSLKLNLSPHKNAFTPLCKSGTNKFTFIQNPQSRTLRKESRIPQHPENATISVIDMKEEVSEKAAYLNTKYSIRIKMLLEEANNVAEVGTLLMHLNYK